MFNWYKKRKLNKHFSTVTNVSITIKNYRSIGYLVREIDTSQLGDLLPVSKSSLRFNFNTINAVALLEDLNYFINKLNKGENINKGYSNSTMGADDWFTDAINRPVILNVYIKEIVRKYEQVEGLLGDVESKGKIDLEYYLNKLSPTLKDILTICKILLK